MARGDRVFETNSEISFGNPKVNMKIRELGAITIAGISLLGIAALAAIHGEPDAAVTKQDRSYRPRPMPAMFGGYQ
jgi:hypothetical protein